MFQNTLVSIMLDALLGNLKFSALKGENLFNKEMGHLSFRNCKIVSKKMFLSITLSFSSYKRLKLSITLVENNNPQYVESCKMQAS